MDTITRNKLVQQMEYYFSDKNLARDKFMRNLLIEYNRYIPVRIFLTFNKINELTCSAYELMKALQHSNILKLHDTLVYREDLFNGDIKRKLRELEQECKLRTLTILGFDKKARMKDITNFFGEHILDVENIIMRRAHSDQSFRGSIYVTFDTYQNLLKFYSDPKMKQYNRKELEIITETLYELKRPPNRQRQPHNELRDRLIELGINIV